LRQISAWLSDR